MSIKKRHNMSHYQSGVSLIELMVSITLGLLLMLAATAMTASSMIMNADTLRSAKLNQDVDSVIQIMVNDIRRAGYGVSALGKTIFAYGEDLDIVNSSCVLYTYDSNKDRTPDDDERYGFKLVGSEIHMRTTCSASDCASNCTVGTWVPLTDDKYVSITKLTFDSEHSKCLNLTDPDNVVALSNDNNYWVTNNNTVTDFPCSATSGTNLTTYVLDADDIYQSTGTTFVAPQSGDRLVEVRQVNIEIEGALTNDNSMKKSQRVGVNVRNNHIQEK